MSRGNAFIYFLSILNGVIAEAMQPMSFSCIYTKCKTSHFKPELRPGFLIKIRSSNLKIGLINEHPPQRWEN